MIDRRTAMCAATGNPPYLADWRAKRRQQGKEKKGLRSQPSRKNSTPVGCDRNQPRGCDRNPPAGHPTATGGDRNPRSQGCVRGVAILGGDHNLEYKGVEFRGL